MYNITTEKIIKYKIPAKLLENAPFDVVLVDAPQGFITGRLLPTFWTVNNLTKPGSIMYMHDTNRDG